jgi:hypothetical protein
MITPELFERLFRELRDRGVSQQGMAQFAVRANESHRFLLGWPEALARRGVETPCESQSSWSKLKSKLAAGKGLGPKAPHVLPYLACVHLDAVLRENLVQGLRLQNTALEDLRSNPELLDWADGSARRLSQGESLLDLPPILLGIADHLTAVERLWQELVSPPTCIAEDPNGGSSPTDRPKARSEEGTDALSRLPSDEPFPPNPLEPRPVELAVAESAAANSQVTLLRSFRTAGRPAIAVVGVIALGLAGSQLGWEVGDDEGVVVGSLQARFHAEEPSPCYFVFVANGTPRNVEITHVWYQRGHLRQEVTLSSRPLPRLLQPAESWTIWIPSGDLPAEYRETAFGDFYVRLSTGDVLASRHIELPRPGPLFGGPAHPEDESCAPRGGRAEAVHTSNAKARSSP